MKKNLVSSRHFIIMLGAMIMLSLACTKEETKKDPTPVPKVAPEVTTAVITNITQTTATGGGEVTKEGTSLVTMRGICWDTLQNPTIENSHSSNGSGLGAFVSQMSGLTGETVYYVRAYAISDVDTVYGAEVSFETEQIPFTCGMSVKYEGKSYRTVQIGTQCWFKDNLDVGGFIMSVPTANVHSDVYDNNVIEKYCYNNVPENCNTYGGLYDWDEMMGYTTAAGAKGICPEGWHIPTDDEWVILTSFLGGSSVAGGKLKSTGTTHWNTPNIGASNSSGFTALPGGQRSDMGAAFNLNTYGYFWSSTTGATNTAYFISLYFNSQISTRNNYDRKFGFSVRCLQN